MLFDIPPITLFPLTLFFLVLWMELRAFHTLDKCSATELPDPNLHLLSVNLGSLLSRCFGEAGMLVSGKPGSKVKSEMLAALYRS